MNVWGCDRWPHSSGRMFKSWKRRISCCRFTHAATISENNKVKSFCTNGRMWLCRSFMSRKEQAGERIESPGWWIVSLSPALPLLTTDLFHQSIQAVVLLNPEAPSEAAIVLCILKLKVSLHILPQDPSSCVDGDGFHLNKGRYECH